MLKVNSNEKVGRCVEPSHSRDHSMRRYTWHDKGANLSRSFQDKKRGILVGQDGMDVKSRRKKSTMNELPKMTAPALKRKKKSLENPKKP